MTRTTIIMLIIVSLMFTTFFVDRGHADFTNGSGGNELAIAFLGIIFIGVVAVGLAPHVANTRTFKTPGWVEANACKKDTRSLPLVFFTYSASTIIIENETNIYDSPDMLGIVGTAQRGSKFHFENEIKNDKGLFYYIKSWAPN